MRENQTCCCGDELESRRCQHSTTPAVVAVQPPDAAGHFEPCKRNLRLVICDERRQRASPSVVNLAVYFPSRENRSNRCTAGALVQRALCGSRRIFLGSGAGTSQYYETLTYLCYFHLSRCKAINTHTYANASFALNNRKCRDPIYRMAYASTSFALANTSIAIRFLSRLIVPLCSLIFPAGCRG